MNKPTVSIIMSTFNNASYIKDAIDSVLAQSFTDWELIIINDASTDNSDAIIREYVKNDKRFTYFLNKKNVGTTLNSNRCVSLAQGTYIARLDGDDVWIDRDKLKKQVAFLNSNKEYGLVGSWAHIVDKNGKNISNRTYPSSDIDIRNYLLIENCFFHSSVMIRRTIFNQVDGYNPAIETAEDYNLWLNIGLVSKMHNVPEYMINYRINPEGVNSTRYDHQLRETLHIVQKFKNAYPNYKIGIIFWHLRKFIPKRIKLVASEVLKIIVR